MNKGLNYMKKRVLSLFVAAALFMSPACAADTADTVFSDVPADAWYADAVMYCQSQGWLSGTSESRFSPNDSMTRAMLATVLYRYSGSPAVSGDDEFTDTDEGAWYFDGVLWASKQGLMTGYGEGRFGTNDPVSREQLAAILWRSEGSPASEDSSDGFADHSSIAPYAREAAAWCREKGIISGKDGNRFDPKGNATRAEVAVILKNAADAAQTEKAPEPEPSISFAPVVSGGAFPVQIPQPEVTPEPEPTIEPVPEETEMKLVITIGEREFTAALADTDAAREFAQMLPMTIDMSELNGNEKYYYMDKSLSAAAQRPDKIYAGDIMLYGSSCLVLFYESFSTSYSYTALGHIDDPAGLADVVGNGGVTVTIAIDE